MVGVAVIAEIDHRLTTDWVYRVVQNQGLFNNIQKDAANFLVSDLEKTGVLEKCIEIMPALGNNINAWRTKLKFATNPSLLSSGWFNSDVSLNGALQDSANSSKFFDWGFNFAANCTGLESRLSIWHYSGAEPATGVSRHMVGGSISTVVNIVIGLLASGSREAGSVASGFSGSDLSSIWTGTNSGFFGTQCVSTTDRRQQGWLNGVLAGSPSTAAATGTFTSATNNRIMASGNDVASAFVRRSQRGIFLCRDMFGLEKGFYDTIQTYQQLLGRAF